ncbi:MAG: glycosyltransferase family 2 protein [Chthoniobacterales bacterium]|nr:glycosyltransferase family 2 protein [Chthoniobacterales bacterium]
MKLNRPEVARPAPPPAYHEWRKCYARVDQIALRRQLRQLREQPLISILLPVYNPDLELLDAAIDSVRQQVYERWELCVADDASVDTQVRPWLEKRAARDPRIKLTFRQSNGQIAACSNSAFTLATGGWCALFDQDDALSRDALAHVASEIEAHPEARLIYSDEDKIDLAGVHSQPFFKTDWDPELFLAQNYINHLGVYETEMLRSLGGFREGYEGSQDYDLALRFSEHIRAEQVRHIPRILYHWRMAPGSVAQAAEAKPYAKEAARRALRDHLQRKNVAGRVEACPENNEAHRVIYALPEPPLVTIIVPTRDRVALLRRCLESLRDLTDYSRFEIVVVDNGSSEMEALEYLRRLEAESQARVITDAGLFNFSRLNNLAAAEARGEILAFLNNDIEVTEAGWLTEMVSHATRPNVGAVGARLWYANGTLQHGGVILGLGGMAGHAFEGLPRRHPGYFDRAFLQRDCSAVTGACMLVRKDIFAEAGSFDEKHFAVNFNDVDFCLRLRQRSLRIIWTPYANLIHHESASRGSERTPEAKEEFLREAAHLREKWGAQLLCDPFYSANFSLQKPGYEIAFPPRHEQRRQHT